MFRAYSRRALGVRLFGGVNAIFLFNHPRSAALSSARAVSSFLFCEANAARGVENYAWASILSWARRRRAIAVRHEAAVDFGRFLILDHPLEPAPSSARQRRDSVADDDGSTWQSLIGSEHIVAWLNAQFNSWADRSIEVKIYRRKFVRGSRPFPGFSIRWRPFHTFMKRAVTLPSRRHFSFSWHNERAAKSTAGVSRAISGAGPAAISQLEQIFSSDAGRLPSKIPDEASDRASPVAWSMSNCLCLDRRREKRVPTRVVVLN